MNGMLKTFQIVIFEIVVSGSLCAGYGVFKQRDVWQPLKISITTKLFLQSVLEKQHHFVQQRMAVGKDDQKCVQLVRTMSGLYQTIIDAATLNPDAYRGLMHENELLKSELMQQQGNFYFSQPEQVWFEWFYTVFDAVGKLQIYSRSQDLQWLQQQLQTFESMIRSYSWDNALMQKIVMRTFELCNEMMQLFDGTFVNDFDLLVLSSLVVVMMALRC